MAGTIAYDKPIRDFIDGLNATGHVTNTAYRKTSVTFHHNGGRLSLEGILDVWKTRPASAHFQVDGQGDLGQYVKLNEYAWATGNTEGNKSSVNIELANATTAPDWTVAEVTWKEGARLAGWIFARAFGFRPDRSNVKVHHDWKSTLCAGPFIDRIYDQLLAEVQRWYDVFATHAAPPPPPAAPAPSGLSFDQVVAGVIAGQYGNGDDRARRVAATGQNYEAVRAEVNRRLGGGAPAPAPARKSNDQIASEVINGEWGNGPERSRKLQAAGYSPTEVQNIVNARLGGGSTSVRLSIGTLADQVIRGQWGNGAERQRRITSAGYDYQAVRAEVNRRL